MAGFWDNPFWREPNGYGGKNPVTGERQDWYDTPEVRDDPDNESAFLGEWERFLSRNGFGGSGNIAMLARNQLNRARAGFDAAQLSNPGVTWRRYLNNLGSRRFQNFIAGMSPQQRGFFGPSQTRVVRDG